MGVLCELISSGSTLMFPAEICCHLSTKVSRRLSLLFIREVKHDVYGKPQTANGKNNSDFAHFFFST